MTDRPRWRLHADGSFDLLAPGVELAKCYPSMEYAPVRPARVEVHPDADPQRIVYHLPVGRLVLRFSGEADHAKLRASLEDVPAAPHWVWPLGCGQVRGANELFRQGLGFAGPSGLVPIRTGGDPVSLESYAVTGLRSPSGESVAFGATETRDFLQKSTLHNRVERFGLVNRHVTDEVPIVEAGFATEEIPLPGGVLNLPELRFCTGPSAYDALHTLARAIGERMTARTHWPPRYHWCSWYYAYHNLSLKLLEEYLAGMASLDPPVPIQSAQIDAGYFPHHGDYLETTPDWPGGMKPAFDAIERAGYRPGIWIGAFMVGNRSRVFQEHPDWILRDRDGQPVVENRSYRGSGMSGTRDEELYTLDTSHPAAFEHLRTVFRTMRAAGARFFKTDFMDWGLKDSTLVRRHQPGKTSVQYFREVMEMIREEIGEESYWLGCICPFAPSIGLVDGMRIANDTGPQWASGSTGNMIAESLADQYFNNVWWQNDPDVLYVRDFHTFLDETETRSLALFQAFLGGSVNTSDPLGEVAPDRLKLWRFLQPGEETWTARLPYWEQARSLLVAVRRYEDLGAWAVLAVNPRTERAVERMTLAELAGRERSPVFAWGPDGSEPLGDLGEIVCELPAHGSALYYVSPDGTPPPGELTLGGARQEALSGG